MSRPLKGKTAVVTGGASGNGRAIARRFADQGADIVVADIRAEPRQGGLATHRKILNETDQEATFVDCNVSERGDLELTMDAAEAFGGVDIMVNTAGIVIQNMPLTEMDWEAYGRLMRVNLGGVVYGSHAAAKRMVSAGTGGCIINLSSAAGIEGFPRITPYSAAKGAIRTFTYFLAGELGRDGIRVNAIHPGVVETATTIEDASVATGDAGEAFLEKIPLERLGQPEDVADTALYLASACRATSRVS